MPKQQSKCLTCDRTNIYSRGLCQTCYVAFRRAVNDKRCTEKAAIKRGLVLPRGTGRGGTSAWLTAAAAKNLALGD